MWREALLTVLYVGAMLGLCWMVLLALRVV